MTPLQRKLKSARLKLDLTQEAMAAALAVPLPTLRSWEQGVHQPTPLAAKALNEAVDALVKRN